MHIIPTAVKIALTRHNDRHHGDVVFSVKADIGGGGVTVTFAPDKTSVVGRHSSCITATYFIPIEEIRLDGEGVSKMKSNDNWKDHRNWFERHNDTAAALAVAGCLVLLIFVLFGGAA